MKTADVLILGAGPAGTAAAITAARDGATVTLIDSRKFPRSRPGETLHPGIEPILEQLGVKHDVLKAGFLRHDGHWVEWRGKKQFVPFGSNSKGEWRGFHAKRDLFDDILMSKAKALGVRVIESCPAKAPVFDGDRITGILTPAGLLTGLFIIDAAGGGHWLARNLGTGVIKFTPQLIARYFYSGGDYRKHDVRPSLQATAGGWKWETKLTDDLLHVSTLSFDPNEKPKNTRNLLDADFSVGKGADVTWRLANTLAGDGYFLVGDAGAVLDPLSSHGVLKAIMSGIAAGHLIVGNLSHGFSEELIRSAYVSWFTDWYLRDASELCRFYAQLQYPPPWLPKTRRKLRSFETHANLAIHSPEPGYV